MRFVFFTLLVLTFQAWGEHQAADRAAAPQGNPRLTPFEVEICRCLQAIPYKYVSAVLATLKVKAPLKGLEACLAGPPNGRRDGEPAQVPEDVYNWLLATAALLTPTPGAPAAADFIAAHGALKSIECVFRAPITLEKLIDDQLKTVDRFVPGCEEIRFSYRRDQWNDSQKDVLKNLCQTHKAYGDKNHFDCGWACARTFNSNGMVGGPSKRGACAKNCAIWCRGQLGPHGQAQAACKVLD